MKKINFITLLSAIFITQLAGIIGLKLSGSTADLYSTLVKPPLSPPGWLFGIVWPILYLLMGVSLYIIYESPKSHTQQNAINLFLLQLLVNALWPAVFFRFEMYWLAFVVILLLDVLVAGTILLFYNIDKKAGYLLLPYMAWILFATYLNLGVAILN